MELRTAIEEIWEEQRNGIYQPTNWRGKLNVEEGYRVQLGILERRVKDGERQAGWKVGLTAKAIQKQVGHHEQVFGYLLESGQRESGVVLLLDELIRPILEPELCLTVGTTLRGPGVTPEQAREAITAAAAAFEVAERRADFVADIPLSLADNVQQKYFVTGPALQPLPPELDLSEVVLELCVNGTPVDGDKGSAVMGGPHASVAWLANRLAAFDRRLEKGMRVMSGSFTKQIAITQGDLIEARFSGIGSVTVEFR